LKPEELEKEGLVQFPLIMGGVVPVINVKGIDAGVIKLSPELLASIFLGKITKWNDERIAKINKGIKLPSQDITVVHRADGSGTTWIFTNYLDKISQEWHEKVGTDKAVSWPIGVGGKGNEGVAAYVQQVNGSIGYVEYAYALQNKMTYIQLENRAGKYVPPTIETFQAAAQGADWKSAPGYYLVLTNQSGDSSWPITGASFILVHKEQKDAARAKAMVEFFDWCLKTGSEIAKSLDYVPMPQTVTAMIQTTWEKDLRSSGKVVWAKK
jgi:phosphate transport system substrate-binding protein